MSFKRFASVAFAAGAAAVQFSVESSGGNAISPYQYGITFEDINNSGDGEVYAELIQNRAFQGDEIFPENLDYWYPLGGAKLALSNNSTPLSQALPSSLQVTGGSSDTVGFWNEGFWGFPRVASWQYNGSFYMSGSFNGNISICMVSNTTGDTIAEASVQASSQAGKWTDSIPLPVPANVHGPLNFNLLSLLPPTYNNRPNGLRIDLMQAIADLNPKFFRLPGGNNLEGNQPPYWWKWTETLGPLENRPGFPGTWSYENTNGLGLMEYMLWAEDLNTEVILGVWAGLWLNGTHVPQDQLQPYIQCALDELEFLTGDASTHWGSYRAELGHPEPFTVNFVGVGNEDSLSMGKDTYGAYRFSMFHNAIKGAYPNITVISSYYDVDESTEAIYLLSAERNSDNILGAGYAPGFMNLNRWEWIPDMIAFDANPAHLILSTSYYVVQLLSSIRITQTLPTTDGEYGPAYWVAGKGETDESRIVKAVVYNSTGDVPFSFDFVGISEGATGQLTYLTAPMNASNYVNENYVETHKQTIAANGTTFSWSMLMYSVGILEVGGGAGNDSYGNGSYGGGWEKKHHGHGWKG